MRRLLDWSQIVICGIAAIYCMVQQFRGVPVQPSWLWGMWAYAAAVDMACERLRRAE